MADSLENQYDNEKFIDYYKILDIDIEATNDQIKTSYIKLAKRHHPDQINGNSEAFQLISKAYEVLIGKESRKEYDLYYLKKSFNELKEDTFFGMKDSFNEFVHMSEKKKLSKDELDKLYDDVFKDKENFKEKTLEKDDTAKKLNDINLERETLAIEESDDSLQIFMNKNPDLNINEVFNYLKSTNQSDNLTNENSQLTELKIGTLDTIIDNNFSSFIDGDDTNMSLSTSYYTQIDANSGFIPNPKDKVEKLTATDISDWKYKRKLDSKLNSDDIESYLSKRKQEENQLLNDVENNLITNIKKRTNNPKKPNTE
jgi:curved DNA-binding protein